MKGEFMDTIREQIEEQRMIAEREIRMAIENFIESTGIPVTGVKVETIDVTMFQDDNHTIKINGCRLELDLP